MFGTRRAGLMDLVVRLRRAGREKRPELGLAVANPIRRGAPGSFVGTETFFATARTLWWAR